MADHIVRHDRTRVLADVEAKRRMVEPWPCSTLKLLALPYADQSGYRDEWKPDRVVA